MQRPLFLTGMMGCGKTTIGRILAHELGVPLVDLDARIERLFGADIPALFAERGEPGFRVAEHEALGSLLAEPGLGGRGVVVATGGGAVLHEGSREAMDRVGTRVYLEVGVDELVRRLRPEVEDDDGARPLLHGGLHPAGLHGGGLQPAAVADRGAPEAVGSAGARLRQRVAELLAARRSIYRTGALCIDGQGDPATVAARIMVELGGDAPIRGSEAV